MDRITLCPLQPAPAHPAAGLRVTDGRLDRLAPLQPAALLLVHRLVAPAVDDLHRHQVIDAAVAEVDDRRRRLDADVLQQRRRLLDLRGQGVAVVGVAGEGARADDQAASVGDRDACLDAELVRLAALALPDALDLRGVQRVELVLVVTPLALEPLGARATARAPRGLRR